MDRRSFLQAAAVTGVGTTPGCVAWFRDETPDNVVLDPPADQLADSADLAYPAYGEPLPPISLPDPVTETQIETDALDRTCLLTAFFAFCPAECALLLRRFSAVQQAMAEAGLGEAVAFLAITFDPERDDAAALKEHGEMVGADFDAGNWHYLRPPDAEAATQIVDEDLGIGFERVDGGDSRVQGYDFAHIVISLLVNPAGVVERAYRGEDLSVDTVVSDMETVVDLSRE